MKKSLIATAVLLTCTSGAFATEIPTMPENFDFELTQTTEANQNANNQTKAGVWKGVGIVKPMVNGSAGGSPSFLYSNTENDIKKNEGTIWVVSGNLGDEGTFGKYVAGMLANNGGSVENHGSIYVKANNPWNNESAKAMSADQNGTLINNGKIVVDGATAMALTTKAEGQKIINAGTISVNKGFGISININDKTSDASTLTIENSGTIDVAKSQTGVKFNSSFNKGTFTNSGKLTGKGTAINSSASNTTIENIATGVISTSSSYSVYQSGSGNTINNAGVIANTSEKGKALNISGIDQTLNNAGLIQANGVAVSASGANFTMNLSGNSHIEGELSLKDDASLNIINLTSSNEVLDLQNNNLKNLSLDNTDIGFVGEEALNIENLTTKGEATAINLKESRSLNVKNATGNVTIESDHLATKGALVTIENAKNDVAINFTSSVTDSLNPLEAQKVVNEQIKVDGADTTTTFKEGLVNGEIIVTEEGTEIKTNSVQTATLELASKLPVTMTRMLTNDVRKRLGDIRSTEGTHGAWVRYDGGKLSGLNELESDFHTVQLGIDTVPTPDAARMGVAFSYSKGDSEFGRGDSDMDAFSLAFYGTKMYDNGMFVDVIGRMATVNNDLTVINDGRSLKSETDNIALSLSGEMGWRFDLNNLVFVEPQAELTYTYINDDKFKLDSANYAVDSTTSLMGRVGFAAGLKCPSNKGNVYVRASAVHEFLGDSEVTVNNSVTTELDGKDTWVEYGIGANYNITKNTYVWADVERTGGADLDEDWRGTVGVRYAW